MLNPQGFRHAPGSRDGCLLLVRLRQWGGALGRAHVRLDTATLPWLPSPAAEAGVQVKPLYNCRGFAPAAAATAPGGSSAQASGGSAVVPPDSMWLERWQAGVTVRRRALAVTELFVVRGRARSAEQDGHKENEEEVYPQYTWLRLPAGAAYALHTEQGCEVYMHEGDWRPEAAPATV